MGREEESEQLRLFEIEEVPCYCDPEVNNAPAEDCPEHGRCQWICEISEFRCILGAARFHEIHMVACCGGSHA